MTRRERLERALGGEQVLPRATMSLGPCDQADGVCLPLDRMAAAKEQARFVVVRGAFAQSLMRGYDLPALLRSDPIAGEALLGRMKNEAAAEFERALVAEADGILYQLSGASAEWTTPLAYGGHLLETERSVLASETRLDRPLVIHVVGQRDLYLDLVADLASSGLAWNSTASRLSLQEVRRYFSCALVTDSPEADIGWTVADVSDRANGPLEGAMA
jgi:hypothetical protein